MTARQPPREKGAKACMIGNQPVSRRVFLRLFSGIWIMSPGERPSATETDYNKTHEGALIWQAF